MQPINHQTVKGSGKKQFDKWLSCGYDGMDGSGGLMNALLELFAPH